MRSGPKMKLSSGALAERDGGSVMAPRYEYAKYASAGRDPFHLMRASA